MQSAECIAIVMGRAGVYTNGQTDRQLSTGPTSAEWKMPGQCLLMRWVEHCY